MNNKPLAKQCYDLIKPVIYLKAGNNPSALKDYLKTQHAAASIWVLVSPFLVDEIQELNIYPNDEDLQAATRNKIRKLLDQNPGFVASITAAINKITVDNRLDSNNVIESKNILQGNTLNIGGNFQVGDNTSVSHFGLGDIVNGDKIINK